MGRQVTALCLPGKVDRERVPPQTRLGGGRSSNSIFTEKEIVGSLKTLTVFIFPLQTCASS